LATADAKGPGSKKNRDPPGMESGKTPMLERAAMAAFPSPLKRFFASPSDQVVASRIQQKSFR